MFSDFPADVPLLGLTVPSALGLVIAVAFSAAGIMLSIVTSTHDFPIWGMGHRNARILMLVFGVVNAVSVFTAASATNWDLTLTTFFSCFFLIFYGFAANQLVETLAGRLMAGQLRLPPPIPLDLAALNIHQLRSTDPHEEGAGAVRLYKDNEDRNILALPRGSVAASVLQHNGQTLAKIIAPVTDRAGRPVGCRTIMLGLDTTRNPFLLELPPEYKDRSIDECERWLLRAGEDDEVITA